MSGKPRTDNRERVLSILDRATNAMTAVEIWRESGIVAETSVRDTLSALRRDGLAYQLPKPFMAQRGIPAYWRKATR